MNFLPSSSGWIEVVCGPMFSGKTEELIRRLRRAVIAQQRVQVFKPARDDRYAVDSIVTHLGVSLASVSVVRPGEIIQRLDPQTTVVGIDEAQFFDDSVVDVATTLADKGLRVICAGLDLDYRAQSFGPMPQLMSVAEYVTKSLAVCMVCGEPAHRSYRLSEAEEQVLVGSTDAYEARCRRCYCAGAEARSRQGELKRAMSR